MTKNDSLDSPSPKWLTPLLLVLILGLPPLLFLADLTGYLSTAPPDDNALIDNFLSNRDEFDALARMMIETGIPVTISLKSITANYPFSGSPAALDSLRVRMRKIRIEKLSLSADRQCVSFVNYSKYYRRDLHAKSTDFCLPNHRDADVVNNTDSYVARRLSSAHDNRDISVQRKLANGWHLSYNVIR